MNNFQPSQGLLFFNNIVSFTDDFPKDTELYKLLTLSLVRWNAAR